MSLPSISRPHGRPGGHLALVALVATLLTSILGLSGPVYAATTKPTAATHAGPAVKATKTAKVAGPKAHVVDPRAEHLTAVRELTRTPMADTCSGGVQPDTVYSCASPTGTSTSFTLTLPQATDLVAVQAVSTNGQVYPALSAPDGTSVTCSQDSGSSGIAFCRTGQSGTYTLTLNSPFSGSGFTLSYTPLLSDTSCTASTDADRALGAPSVLNGSLAAGASGNCYTVDMSAGQVLRTFSSDWRADQRVFDSTGAQVCTAVNGTTSVDCTLTGTAPYRVLVDQDFGTALDYSLTLARLSTPAGCPVVNPQTYGTVPDVSSTARCRILHVPASAPYEYAPVSTVGQPNGSLYHADGTPACTPILLAPCTLTSGDYTWARTAADPGAVPFGLSFYATDQTQGCTATNDTGYSSGPATGSFTGVGQLICRTLPTPSGQAVYLVDQPPTGGVGVSEAVYDASGVQQCPQMDGQGYGVCPLTGTAPFALVLNASSTGGYQLFVQRTGDGTGCTAWPQSNFGGSFGAQVQLTESKQVVCLNIPANQHSTGEMIDYANTLNQVNASIQVYDAAGHQVCSTIGSSTTACSYTAGAGYTAMLAGVGDADTYKLVRRDLSATATCAAPASTTVGGPSTGFTFSSDLDSRCLRVTAAAGDKLWFGNRVSASSKGGALLGAADASGKIVCWQQGSSCRVSGSSSYVVFLLAENYAGAPISTHVDTWRVGTAAGWVSQCTANPLSVDGFAPRSGILTETSTGSCAVLQVKPSQSFGVYGTDSSTTIGTPSLSLLSATHWNSNPSDYYSYQCDGNYGSFSYDCQTLWNADAGQAVLLLSAGQADAPVEYSMQGVCLQGCSAPPVHATVTSISPPSGPAGTRNQVVLHGTHLNLGTQVSLAQNGVRAGSSVMAWPVSVSADGSSLTVQLVTYGLAPGSYDLVQDGVGYTSGVPSPGYLPGAYTVTAVPATTPSRFVPVTPTRFLDTRYGVGAAKARVGAGGVVALQVAGVHGVPSTGVTAVVMNVTAVSPSASGFVTVYPDGKPVPGVSNINFKAGQTVPNLVTVPVIDGKVDLRNAGGTVDLIADVTGYYTSAATGSDFRTVTPTRFLDTRYGVGAAKARVGAGGVVALQVAGVHGVPSTGVTAVVMNVTAVSPSASGFVTVYPDGKPLPGVSNLNFTAGTTISNLVTVPVVDGKVDLRNAGGTVDLIADVTGYYASSGSTFATAGPVRVLDTRYGLGARIGAVGSNSLVSVPLAGLAGVPSSGVTAVVLNVTVTAPATAGFLTVAPHGAPMPGVSNLNFGAGETISNLVVVPVIDGRITFYNHSGGTQVVADLNGYFAS